MQELYIQNPVFIVASDVLSCEMNKHTMKMASVIQTTFWFYFVNESACIFFSFQFIIKFPIDHEASLVQIEARCQTDNKPLPRPMLTKIKSKIS